MLSNARRRGSEVETSTSARWNAARVDLLKTPDAVAVTVPVTIEIKGAIGSVNSIVQRIREGRWQARHVVVDVRGTGTTRATGEDALRRALIKYQADLDEVVIIVTDDLSVGWNHG